MLSSTALDESLIPPNCIPSFTFVANKKEQDGHHCSQERIKKLENGWAQESDGTDAFFCTFPGTSLCWLHAEAGSITPTRQNPNKNSSQTSRAMVLGSD